jgi:hypothetical protein
VQSLPSREYGSWDLSFHTGFQALSPKYDMDVYMAKTLFGGEFIGTCVESWVQQIARSNSQERKRMSADCQGEDGPFAIPRPDSQHIPQMFLHKIMKIQI